MCCLPILESPFRTVEALSAEYRPPPTVGLMRDTTGRIAAFFAHGQAFGQDRGEVDHRREIIDGYVVRAFVRRAGACPPIRVGSAYVTMHPRPTMSGRWEIWDRSTGHFKGPLRRPSLVR